MKYRGKGIGWTESEDEQILNGEMPKGRTASQVYNRRSKLKLEFGVKTMSMCRNILWRLDYMRRMDLFKPDSRRFFKHFAESVQKRLL